VVRKTCQPPNVFVELVDGNTRTINCSFYVSRVTHSILLENAPFSKRHINNSLLLSWRLTIQAILRYPLHIYPGRWGNTSITFSSSIISTFCPSHLYSPIYTDIPFLHISSHPYLFLCPKSYTTIQIMLSVKDRTSEFHAAVDTIKNRSFGGSFHARNLEHRRPLLNENKGNGKGRTNRSEFSKMAAAIGRDINATAGKLQKLTKCKLNYV